MDARRIGVVGTSMGGEQAIGAAATDARIRAVVAEGATNRVAADKEWQSEEFGLRGAIQEQLDRLTYVPDTGHTAGLDTHPEEWEARVVAFLEEALR